MNQSKHNLYKQISRSESKKVAQVCYGQYTEIHFNMVSRGGKAFCSRLPSLPGDDAPLNETSDHDGDSSCSTLSVPAKLHVRLYLSR